VCRISGTGIPPDATQEVSFTVTGYVQPKQRTFGRGFVTPPETRAYENEVRRAARQAMNGHPPIAGFVGLEREIICRVSASIYRRLSGVAPTIFHRNVETSCVDDLPPNGVHDERSPGMWRGWVSEVRRENVANILAREAILKISPAVNALRQFLKLELFRASPAARHQVRMPPVSMGEKEQSLRRDAEHG
jgi:hypothetical protein